VRVTATAAAVLALAFRVFAPVPTITWGWDPSPETNVVNYTLYWHPASGNPMVQSGVIVTSTVNEVTLPVTNFVFGPSVFTVTARNAAGLESLPSNAVNWTNRYFAPPLSVRDSNVVTFTLQKSDRPFGGLWTNISQSVAPSMTNGFYRGVILLEQRP
jgi:hypothetical protein